MSGLTQRILHGCAALLALALSAFGSPRLGEERPSAPAPEQVLMRLADAVVDQVHSDRTVVEPAPGLTAAYPRRSALVGGVSSNPGSQLVIPGGRGPRAP